jgi:hypothetical protein
MAAESITVLRSTAPGFKTGDMLTEGQSISVPRDRVLDVMSISGIQARISDYSGPLQVSGRQVETTRLEAVTSAVLGRDQGTTAIGGTRGGPGTHVAIDRTSAGHWCLVDGVSLVVTRGDAMERETMTMKSMVTGQTEILSWSRYAVSMDWPSSFAVRNGAKFSVAQQGASAKTVTLHVLPDGQTPSQRVFALARHKCTAQLEETAAVLDQASVE